MKKMTMKFHYKDKDYEVIIVKKNNKNTYIRVKDDNVYITTNYFVTNYSLNKLLIDNRKSIERMLDKNLRKKDKEKNFYLFGKIYNIIFDLDKKILIDGNNIYVKDERMFEKWLSNYIKITYTNHLKYWYDLFEEIIPRPNLKIRKMKTRWGVCNTRNNNVTLNYELYKYDIECLDYVIVHELSHFIEANHSKRFWKVVEKYYPGYKEIRKKLRE